MVWSEMQQVYNGESNRILYARTGNVGVNPLADDPRCPNDGSPLRMRTWREFAEEVMAMVEQRNAEVDALRAENAELRVERDDILGRDAAFWLCVHAFQTHFNDYWRSGETLVTAAKKIASDLAALRTRAESAEAREREALDAHSASVVALASISRLTALGGEVDDYNDVVGAVEAVLAAARRDTKLALAVVDAARRMPRRTPASGGASTVHDFRIQATIVCALDHALTEYDDAASAKRSLENPDLAAAVRPVPLAGDPPDEYYGLTRDEFEQRVRDVQAGKSIPHDEAMRRVRESLFEPAPLAADPTEDAKHE